MHCEWHAKSAVGRAAKRELKELVRQLEALQSETDPTLRRRAEGRLRSRLESGAYATLFSPELKAQQEEMRKNTELGAELGYPATTCHLASGDMVILTSDGVIEAMSPTGELFGFARLEQAVASGPLAGAEAMLGHLRTAVDMFVAGDEPHDDVTIVIVQVHSVAQND